MSERRTMLWAVALVAIGVAVAALLLARAWGTEERPFYASVPQPPPLTSTPVVPLLPDRTVCIAPVTVLPTSEVALIRVGTRGKPAGDMSAVVEGPGGYRSGARLDGSQWRDNDMLRFVLDPPERPLEGRFCVRNDGRRTVDVYGADDRTKSLSVTRVEGRKQPENIQLAFAEREPGTVVGHSGEIAEKITAFRPGVVQPWVVWALAVLVFLALAAGPSVALVLSLRRTAERRAEPGLDLPGGAGPRPARDEVAPGGRAG